MVTEVKSKRQSKDIASGAVDSIHFQIPKGAYLQFIVEETEFTPIGTDGRNSYIGLSFESESDDPPADPSYASRFFHNRQVNDLTNSGQLVHNSRREFRLRNIKVEHDKGVWVHLYHNAGANRIYAITLEWTQTPISVN